MKTAVLELRLFGFDSVPDALVQLLKNAARDYKLNGHTLEDLGGYVLTVRIEDEDLLSCSYL